MSSSWVLDVDADINCTADRSRGCFARQGQRSHRLVIFAAIVVLMTLLILYGSNNINDVTYTPFHVAANYAIKATDLKKWSGKDGYVPFQGNKVLNSWEAEMCPHMFIVSL